MQKTAPYHIQHVQLDEGGTSQIAVPEIGTRYYYVFWWKFIPLGHFYKEEGSIFDVKEDFTKVITPVLKSYKANQKEIENITETIRFDDFLAFSKIIEQLLYPYLEFKIPNEVDISVIICTRNRSESLKYCLDSLNQQICRPREIIVVDNAPTNKLTKLMVKSYANVTYCKEPRPGLDIARNTGARLAKFPIIAYTDDDVRVDKLWSYRVWEVFLEQKTDAMTGLIIASSLETESQQIFEKHWGFNKGYEDIYYNVDFITKTSTAPKVWEIGAGANMAFRKKAIEDVNYFDERLDVGAAGCSGDSEIWYRLLANHKTIHYNPRACVHHEHRKGLKELHKQLFGYMRGHSASVLIQHAQDKKNGYKKYLYYELTRYYLQLIMSGFPNFNFRYQTIWSEIKGLISGIRFHRRNKNKPSVANQAIK